MDPSPGKAPPQLASQAFASSVRRAQAVGGASASGSAPTAFLSAEDSEMVSLLPFPSVGSCPDPEPVLGVS